MRLRATAWRRLAAALAGAALLALGAPLHQHLGAAQGSEPAFAGQAPQAGAAHASADCPACHSNGRARAPLAPAALAARARALPALRLASAPAPAAPSAEAQPPTPPRGPPSPTA
jgi:hypothetical protein